MTVTGLLTPGLHRQPLDPVRSGGPLARGDVPLLLGYTVRGPVGAPVRVRSVRQFEDVFGQAPAHGHLWHALKGFVETGGRDAYVLRVATPTAHAASVDAGDGTVAWRAAASFPWLMVDPRRLRAGRHDEAWQHVVERQVLEAGPRSAEPGAWGNGLAVEVRRTARARTATLPGVVDEGAASLVASLAGLGPASVLELAQPGPDGATRTVTAVPAGVDRVSRLVRWRRPLDAVGLDPGRPVRLTSVEFDVAVYRAGRLEQAFAALAPHPDAAHAVVRVLGEECRALTLAPVVRRRLAGGGSAARWEDEEPGRAAEVLAATDWADPATWPPPGLLALGGGTDGLEDVTAATWLAALEQAARLPDAALVACPDLVLGAAAPPPAVPAATRPRDCTDLTPPPDGHITGLVVSTDDVGAEVPLPGVSVDVAGPGGVAVTDAVGAFALDGVGEGVLTLRLHRAGYEPLEFLAQASPFGSAPPVRISMVRLSAARPLEADEVLQVQRAMADPGRVGPYKVAVVDPPRPDAQVDHLTTWRARLGDDARLVLVAPWLTLPVPEDGSGPGSRTGTGLRPCPPSGHVCGAFAAAEAAVGIHRSGANFPLRYVEGTTLAVGDAEQAQLNPVGVDAVRVLPGRGVRLFGSRSLAADPAWRFVTARRVVDAVEKTLEQALQWVVFEPASVVTRHAVATTAASLLARLHRVGILAGETPEASFAVKCDLENNPAEVRDAGRLVLDVAIAPTDPYEFVLFRLGTTLDALSVTESSA